MEAFVEEDVEECTSTSTGTCSDATINPIPCNSADAILLNEMQASLKKHAGETSRLLLPYVCQFTNTLHKARRMMKKRAAAERPTPVQEGAPSDGILLHKKVFFYRIVLDCDA